MTLMQPCGWADDAVKYRNRFYGFWKVFETILLSMMDRVKSRKLTAVVGSSISHVKIPKLFMSAQKVCQCKLFPIHTPKMSSMKRLK